MTQQDIALLTELLNHILECEAETPVAESHPPAYYLEQLDLQLSDEPQDRDQLEKTLKDLLYHVPKTSTDHFFNQLFGGRQAIPAIADMLASFLNNSMYTYKVAGPMILMEQAMLKEIARRVGYKESLGTMAPGGSMTNFMALLMARDRYREGIADHGVVPNMVCYTSQESHYSIGKNAAFAGIGRAAVRKVAVDAAGRMDPEDLDRLIREDIAAGNHPFFVNATAGTTVLSAFDPIDRIADVLDSYPKIWLHVDGAYGGSVMWSRKYEYLIKGSERSDSFSVNPHKLLGVPLSTSIIVTKHAEALYRSFSTEADYLFQMDHDELNPGKISLQCGRRNDGLKFFALWKAVGNKGLEEIVDRHFALAQRGRDYVEAHPDYTLYHSEDSVSVCFNYKDIPAEDLCSTLYKDGQLVVGYGSFREDTFVRLIMVNPSNREDHIDHVFETIERYG